MKCLKCGRTVDDDSRYCEHCGAELETMAKTVRKLTEQMTSLRDENNRLQGELTQSNNDTTEVINNLNANISKLKKEKSSSDKMLSVMTAKFNNLQEEMKKMKTSTRDSDTGRKWKNAVYVLVILLVAAVAWNFYTYSQQDVSSQGVFAIDTDSIKYNEQIQSLTQELEETKQRAERLDDALKKNANVVRDTVVVEKEKIVEKTVAGKPDTKLQAENKRLQNELNSSKKSISSQNATINSLKDQVNDLKSQNEKLTNKLIEKLNR